MEYGMKITDIKSAYIGHNVVLRVVTDKGVDGYSQIEQGAQYVRELVPYYRNMIVGCDPTDVEDTVRRMRRVSAFKPWGKVCSSIEMALWDIAGKEAGLPIYKLMGGKVRDRVRVYNGGFSPANPPHKNADTPEKRGENILHLNEIPEGFSIVKTALGWHVPDYYKDTDAYNTYTPDVATGAFLRRGSLLMEAALKNTIDYISRVKAVVGDRVGLAFDMGPNYMPTDIIRIAKAVEHLNVMWLEDTITGDYTPYTSAKVYRDVTSVTTTPIHTGEQIFLRQNFMDLIENRAVDIIGPDPADVGGIAELKWVTEYADLHGILMAPHGVGDGIFGIAALTQVCATLPQNYIAFELPAIRPDFWMDITEGLPGDYLRDSHIKVWDTPGVGVVFNENKAVAYLSADDKDFFL